MDIRQFKKKYLPYLIMVLVGLIMYIGLREYYFPHTDLFAEIDDARKTLPFTIEDKGITFQNITYDDNLNVVFYIELENQDLEHRLKSENYAGNENSDIEKSLHDLFKLQKIDKAICGSQLVKAIYLNGGRMNVDLKLKNNTARVLISLICTYEVS